MVIAAKMYKFLGVCLLAVVLCGLPSLAQGELGTMKLKNLTYSFMYTGGREFGSCSFNLHDIIVHVYHRVGFTMRRTGYLSI